MGSQCPLPMPRSPWIPPWTLIHVAQGQNTQGSPYKRLTLKHGRRRRRASQVVLVVPTCQCRRHKRCRLSPWVGKIPWRRKWQPTPVFLPEETHGQRSLVGYGPWGHKESDMKQNNLAHTHRFRKDPPPLLQPPKSHPFSISLSHTSTAAAKSLQSCPTLCGPIDGSPPGSLVPRILQARTPEWVAISFSNAWKWLAIKISVFASHAVWESWGVAI